jgi:hypothetical protein
VPKNICYFGGCNAIIPGNQRYCEENLEYAQNNFHQNNKDRNRRYDNTIRHVRERSIQTFIILKNGKP